KEIIQHISVGNDKKTTFTYDYGLANSIRTPEFLVNRVISADGTITSETRRGFTTSYGYDNLLRPTSISPPAGITATSISYANDTGLTATRSRGSSSITTTFDGFGRATLTTNSLGESAATRYDACGHVAHQGFPYKPGLSPGGTDI